MVSMSLATVAVLTCAAACIVRFAASSPTSSPRVYALMKESDVLLINGGVLASQEARSYWSENIATGGVVTPTPEERRKCEIIPGCGYETSRIKPYDIILFSD
jgi:hypothetical protein